MPKACATRGYLSFPMSMQRKVFGKSGCKDEVVAKSSVCITGDTSAPEAEVESEASPALSHAKEPEGEPEAECEAAGAQTLERQGLQRPSAGKVAAERPLEQPCKARACAAAAAGGSAVQRGGAAADDGGPYLDLTKEVFIAESSIGEEAPIGLGIVLESMAKLAPHSNARTVFHATRACPISIGDYMTRLRQYFACSMECYVLALVYIDRAIKREPRLVPDSRSVHRLALCGMLLAAKFQDDIFYSNKFYAQVGGVTVKELNGLEVVMLRILDHRLYVDPAEFEAYHHMVSQAASAKGITG